MRKTFGYVALFWLALPIAAQVSVQGLKIVRPDTGGTFLEWQGYPGRTYFLQVSDPSAPLESWDFAPLVEVGQGQSISYEVSSTADAAFFRLKFTDVPVPPGTPPEDADPDDDGLTNGQELLISRTDPLNSDTDSDGLPDGWEFEHGLDPNDNGEGDIDNGPGGDPDRDGMLNSEEWASGTHPGLADSDGDGVTDGGETDQGTDPNDPEDTPEAEWFVLTGTNAQNVAKLRSRTVKIPQGQSRLVVVLVASDEYDEFTGNSSQYNDLLAWDITGGTLDLMGELDVNSRHDEWDWAVINEISVLGFPEVHLEDYHSVQAPSDGELEITALLSATNIGDDILPSTVIVGVLPIAFEITHTEKERDADGIELEPTINPGANVLLRDEIASLKITVPAIDKEDWDLTLDLEPEAMRSQILGDRGSVQMYDFGRIDAGAVVPLTVGANGSLVTGPYPITLPGNEAGVGIFRIVVNKEGAVRLRLKSADNRIDVQSQEFTVGQRIRKYATRENPDQLESNDFDPIFTGAVTEWPDWKIGNANGNYTFKDDADRYTPELLKAIAWKECDLHPANAAAHGTTQADIMQVNAGNRPGSADMTGASSLADWNDRSLAVAVEVLVDGSYEFKELFAFEADPPGNVPVADFSVCKMRYPATGLEQIESPRNSVKWALRKLLYKQYDLGAADFLISYRVRGHGETLFGLQKPELRSLSETLRRYGDTQANYPVHVLRMQNEGIGTRGTGDEYRWPRLTNDKARH